MRILLVDDCRLMRRYVARTLQMTGIDLNIVEANNGLEAIATALGERPDLIITDLNMPEMDGEELIVRVTTDPELCGIPILVLSADRSAGRSEQIMHEGAVAYLTKPVTPEELRLQLLDLVGSHV